MPFLIFTITIQVFLFHIHYRTSGNLSSSESYPVELYMNQMNSQVCLKLWHTSTGNSMLVVSCNQPVIHYTSFYADPDISATGKDTYFWKQTLLRHTGSLLIEQSISMKLGSSMTCWCLSSQTTSWQSPNLWSGKDQTILVGIYTTPHPASHCLTIQPR